jgi:hypothetical protein
MCSHGMPSFAGFPQLHVPNLDSNVPVAGITTVNFAALTEDFDTVAL